jgi:hypothetical protein
MDWILAYLHSPYSLLFTLTLASALTAIWIVHKRTSSVAKRFHALSVPLKIVIILMLVTISAFSALFAAKATFWIHFLTTSNKVPPAI